MFITDPIPEPTKPARLCPNCMSDLRPVMDKNYLGCYYCSCVFEVKKLDEPRSQE